MGLAGGILVSVPLSGLISVNKILDFVKANVPGGFPSPYRG